MQVFVCFQVYLMEAVISAFETAVKSVSDWVALAFDTPYARAVVFGVPIKGVMMSDIGRRIISVILIFIL